MNPAIKSILKKAGIICLSTILFAMCSVLIYITKITGNMHRLDGSPEIPVMETNPNIPAEPMNMGSGYWTIAVFGVDSRNGDVGKGNHADVQLLCSINAATGDIRLVSVYRDTFLMNSPSTDGYGKLSQSYMVSGPNGNVQALTANLDITIDDYISFNWKSVADVINLLGGVDIELTKAEFHYINAFITETADSTGIPSVHLSDYGMQHLDGVQAVAYMRLRQMDTDFARTERQRRVISQVFEKAKDTDPGTLLQVADTAFSQSLSSLTAKDLVSMIRNIKKFNLSSTAGFPFTHEDAPLGKNGDCVIPNTLESNVEQLHQFLYEDMDYTCPDRVRSIRREIIKQAVKN